MTDRAASGRPDAEARGEPRREPRRVALVGAGFIAPFHVRALRALDDVELVGVCELDAGRRDRFVDHWQLPFGTSDLEELLTATDPDAVHVLVPPSHHAAVATQCLRRGIDVFLEKPMAVGVEACRSLLAARRQGAEIGVNHNALYRPLVQRLLGDVEAGRIGGVEHVAAFMQLPLRQLSSGDWNHWFFEAPGNVVRDIGAHPVSVVTRLLGPHRETRALASGERILPGGRRFFDTWQLTYECGGGTGSVDLLLGRDTMQFLVRVVGQDGVVDVDLVNGTYLRSPAGSRFTKPLGEAVAGLAGSWVRATSSISRFADYAVGLLRSADPDPFFLGLAASVAAFHRTRLQAARPPIDGAFGLQVVEACEAAIAEVEGGRPAVSRVVAGPSAPREAVAAPSASREAVTDSGAPREAVPDSDAPVAPAVAGRSRPVLVIGASGFIGSRLLASLTRRGHRVRALCRRPEGLTALQPGSVEPFAADVRDAARIREAVRGVDSVVHLAAGGCVRWEEFEATFVGGLDNVVRACLEEGVERLVYVSSIAAYDLGDAATTITESSVLDPRPEERSDYARAKVMSERLLEERGRDAGLQAIIVRPGVVVGPGRDLRHSGVGQWPTPAHCLGWGRGANPLPLVLVDDVAEALASALTQPTVEGRSLNLVGDVRLTAQEYVALLARCKGRPIRFHPQPIPRLWAVEQLKGLLKHALGKNGAGAPGYRDLRSRTMAATFDCERTKERIDWRPVSDREEFLTCAGFLGSDRSPSTIP